LAYATADPQICQIHYLLAASAERDADVAQRGSLEAETWRLPVFRTAHVAQLLFSRLFETFDGCSVEVREHREHSNMDLLQTKN
jgi:hypothetical protein